MMYKLEDLNGYDPIYLARYEEFIASVNRNTPDISAPFGFNRMVTVERGDSVLLPLTNVRFVLTKKDIASDHLSLVTQEGETKLYEYKQWLPRVYLADQVVTVSTKQAAIDQLFLPDFVSSRGAVVESQDTIEQMTKAESDTVDSIYAQENAIGFETRTDNNRFVVISNIYDGPWQAFIDGQETQRYRTNYIYQGIIVPAGRHNIKIEYNPFSI